jgi:hypothetical protein
MADIENILDAQRKWQAVAPNDEVKLRAAAIESLASAAEAFAVLRDNLLQIGYRWTAIQPVSAEMVENNAALIEKSIGLPVPPVLKLFWEKIGGVSLVDLEGYRHTDFWKDLRLVSPAGFCDGLYIEPCTEEWAKFTCSDYLDWMEYRESEDECFLLTLSPDGYHKDNISGGAPYGVYAEAAWKPAWQNFAWSGIQHPITAIADPPDFLSYLRTTILECAGFPALYGMAGFKPIRERLLLGISIF